MGFIKISRHYQSCLLQIRARGIPAGNGTSLELYAFCREPDGRLNRTHIASLSCFGHSISERLSVAEAHFPEGRPLAQIDGFIIRLPESDCPLFWMASAFFFDVNTDILQDIGENPAPESAAESPEPSNSGSETADPTEPAEPREEESGDASIDTDEVNTDEADMANTDLAETEPAPPVQDDPVQSDPVQTDPIHAASIPAETAPERSSGIRKIRHSDLSDLPRKFWQLSSNSFLLHGYHNYGHLVLFEENGRTWLGVPGIYDAHEARAAELFGFPRFVRSCTAALDLAEDERDTARDFGHWCRCVGLCRPKSP